MHPLVLVSLLCLVAGCTAAPTAAFQEPSMPRELPSSDPTRSEELPASSIASTGRQVPLAQARVPFAHYLDDMHQRLHPEYANAFLENELSKLPADHRLTDPMLNALIELQVDGESGALLGATAIRASSEAGFDELVIGAIRRAAPFLPAPPVIHSSDGNVYVHWEFHRRREYACSTYFSRPYLLSFAEANGE